MKFLKRTILVFTLLSAILATILYTACEKDNCNGVTCQNGGACSNGVCSCPTGYENTQCQTKSVARFIGTFAGYTSCNGGNQDIDSAFIYADSSSPKNINYVYVQLNSIQPVILHGYVQTNASTYSIIIPKDSSANYFKIYTITLQNNNSLNIASYEQNESVPGDTIINKCTFVGFSTATP